MSISKRSLFGALALVVAIGCSSQQVEKSDEPASGSKKAASGEVSEQEAGESGGGESGWNGNERLGDRVVPQSYELELRVDPGSKTFGGEVTVEAELEESVERIRMHAEELEFSKLRAVRDGETVAVEHESVDNGGLVLRFEEELAPGSLELHFEYEGPLDEVPEGLYRVEDDGSWYAFTQLEPLEAREMYPCFDEPKFKTPFSVAVTVPEGMMAAGNAPRVAKNRLEGEEMVEYRFAKTEPLPTYLVAIAVGNFDVVEASEVVEAEDRLEDVPMRVLTTEGEGELGKYALRKSPALVRFQEQYFGIEHPYEKLDLVAVPNFAAGAMENVGLVTFRESLLLLDEESASIQDEYWAQSVMAHEYAHMWFGNLVTLGWWDELWLNEAFATWMASRTIQHESPELEPEVQAVRRRADVISSDSLKKARAIRQPIESGGDVYNAFDTITYQKGAAVLRMFEAWLGEKGFRKGVRAYLDANRHGTGHTEELLAALSEASGKPVRETIANFLNQPGAPMVTVEYDREECSKEGDPVLTLRQTRYLPVGSEASVGKPWKIPMCIRYGDGEGSVSRQCYLFDGTEEKRRRQTVTLETESCPKWVHPNADETGYYHWEVEPRGLQKRLVENRADLTLPERVALLGHFEAQVRSEALEPSAYFEAMETMSNEPHRAIVRQIIDSLKSFKGAVYRGDAPEAFHSYARKVLERHYERVGFAPEEGDSPGTKLVRPGLVKAMANLAADTEVRQRAEEVTRRFLDDPESVEPTVLKYAIDIAARTGDEVLWKRIRDAVDDAPNPDMRSELLGALGRFESPELAKRSLDLFLTDSVRSQHFWTIAGPVSGDPETVEIVWKWMTDNYSTIVEKVGKAHAGHLPWIGGAYCSKKSAERVETFFSNEEHQTVSTERNLAKSLQSIHQCAAYRKLVSEPVRSFLEK